MEWKQEGRRNICRYIGTGRHRVSGFDGGQRRASFPMMQVRQTKAATNPGLSITAVCPCQGARTDSIMALVSLPSQPASIHALG